MYAGSAEQKFRWRYICDSAQETLPSSVVSYTHHVYNENVKIPLLV